MNSRDGRQAVEQSGRPAAAASARSVPTPVAADNTLLRGRATVNDVARIAKVSGRTVSRVVAGGPNVSADTHRRVMEAVELLRFRPNRLARELRTGGGSTTVGFVVGDLTNPFYAQVAAGIERFIVERGLTMLLTATGDDPAFEPRAVGAVLEHRVRALLLVPIGEDHGYLDDERAHGTTIVAVDRPAANADLDCVVFDNRGGAGAGIQNLIDAGHRRIAFVGSDRTLYTHRERLAGYTDTLQANAVHVLPEWIRTDAPDDALAARATQELLDSSNPPTAIFAANNVAARGVLRVLHGHRTQIALVAFDDFDFAETLGITVIAHDPWQMGAAAARIALGESHGPHAPSTLTLPTHLVRRGSGETPPPAATKRRTRKAPAT